MPDMNDQVYLLKQQYHTSTNLNTRIQLHERFSTNPANWQRWVFDQLDIAPDSHVLELGTGSGQLWKQNIERIPAAWQITLSDFSTGMLQETQESLASNASRFQFALIDAQALPYPDDAFDCVIANHMLYHIPDRARAIAEIRRVLRPAGRFYAATNGEAHLQEMAQLCERAGMTAGGVLLGTGATSTFSLQNGSEQLAPFFAQTDVRLFPNGLAVTEMEPLAAFILSALPSEHIDEAKLDKLRALIEKELAENGFVHISKETGLFIASGVKKVADCMV